MVSSLIYALIFSYLFVFVFTFSGTLLVKNDFTLLQHLITGGQWASC